MVNLKGKTIVDAEEMGGVLYQIVGDRTEEILCDKDKIKKMGIDSFDQNALGIELININMFILIKQFTIWESDEDIFTKVLDRMHFLLFHQLREDLNYDSDDVENLHEHMFNRYSEYGNVVQKNKNNNWQKELSKAFLNNVDYKPKNEEEALDMMRLLIDNYHKKTPELLDEFIIR